MYGLGLQPAHAAIFAAIIGLIVAVRVWWKLRCDIAARDIADETRARMNWLKYV